MRLTGAGCVSLEERVLSKIVNDMANYCFTNYWIEGDKKVLDKLAATIGKGKYVNEILPEMGMPFSDLSFQEEGYPYWRDAQIIDGVLCFTEEARWEQSQCLWNLMRQENSGIEDIRYYSEVSESELYETNDSEGKHFPFRFTVFCEEIPDSAPPHLYVVSEDNTFLFRTQEELLNSFATHFNWKAASLEQLRCLAEKNGYNLYCSEIEVVNGPTHLGINKMKFDFQRGEDGKVYVTIK